jgi:methyl-accepting chemotaxis protein
MAVRELRRRDEGGAGTIYIPLLVLVLIVTVVAVALLTRVLVEARSINAKAANIARTGRGINASTDAIIQLDKTNTYGKSINETAQPLVPKLDVVVGLANSINGKATSITASALTINSTAKTIGGSGSSINSSAKGIEGNTSAIVPISTSIRAGVVTINQNVMTTIGIAEAVRSDVGNILTTARQTVKESACINQKTATLGPPIQRTGQCP